MFLELGYKTDFILFIIQTQLEKKIENELV